MIPFRPVTLSCAGLTLSPDESAIFTHIRPFGFILFKRNIDSPEQVRSLIQALKAAAGWDCPILIDQEGGRVQRLRPPHWRDYPAMKTIGDARDKTLLQDTITGIAHDLKDLGFSVNCAPVLDVLFDQTHQAIGTRAFSSDPDLVGKMGAKVCDILIEQGITPVIKHMPGQGRSALDSHYDLPVVAAALGDLRAIDFNPFHHVLSQPFARHIWGMVSHIVYTAIDPIHPASLSTAVVKAIREDLGFSGLLLSDDLCMDALKTYGSPAQRVVKTLEAGMDIALYCAGHLEDLKEIAGADLITRPETMDRYDRSLISRR